MVTNTELENLRSPIDTQSQAGSVFDNCVTLTFDLFTAGSMHAERLPCQVWCG